MSQNFWTQLKKPIIIQAPMADVTDAAFRQIIAKYSRPHGPTVFFTEFVSADGLSHPIAREKLKRELYYTEAERPIVAQIFSGRPEKIKTAAKLIVDLGFDGLDINMGCPDRNVEKQGAGAALIKNPDQAKAIIQAAQTAVADADRPIPISVKTRIGYYQTAEFSKWAETLIKTSPAAITFHLRTRQEMSKVPAHWELLQMAVKMAAGSNILIFGNGDVDTVAEAEQKATAAGADGIMIGRGIFGNPWFYSGRDQVTVKERLETLVEHAELFETLFGRTETNKKLFGGHFKSFAVMKKHFQAYVNNFAGAAQLKARLMEVDNAAAVRMLINNFLQTIKPSIIAVNVS